MPEGAVWAGRRTGTLLVLFLAHKLLDSPALEPIQAWWEDLVLLAPNSRTELRLPGAL